MSMDLIDIKFDVKEKMQHIHFVLASLEANYHRFSSSFYNQVYKNSQECLRDSKIILRSLKKQPQQETKNKYQEYSRKYKNLFSAVFV